MQNKTLQKNHIKRLQKYTKFRIINRREKEKIL